MHKSCLFGPVASRRLGRSLGVDLVPSKVCSLNCVYCEAGSTTCATRERKAYIPTEQVLKELDGYLRQSPAIDIVTFSGAGEPTLHSGIGQVIDFIKQRYPAYRVALLTNSTLLPDSAVRAECRAVDLLMPSLDAADDAVMAAVNRPVEGVAVADMIEGLVAFRRESDAEMWLEIFIIPGLNDSADHLAALRRAALRIGPDRVQLNTLDRPGPEPWVRPAVRAALETIAAKLSPLPVEIIARYPALTDKSGVPATKPNAGDVTIATGKPQDPGLASSGLADRIMELVQRRPSTAADLESGLALPADAIGSVLRTLQEQGVLVADRRERGVFYRPSGGTNF